MTGYCYKTLSTDETFSFVSFPRNLWGVYNEDSFTYFAKNLHSINECIEALEKCYGKDNIIRIKS